MKPIQMLRPDDESLDSQERLDVAVQLLNMNKADNTVQQLHFTAEDLLQIVNIMSSAELKTERGGCPVDAIALVSGSAVVGWIHRCEDEAVRFQPAAFTRDFLIASGIVSS